MLHQRRKRLEKLAAKEAAGESFWSENFDERARTKILLALQDAVGGSQTHYQRLSPATRRARLRPRWRSRYGCTNAGRLARKQESSGRH